MDTAAVKQALRQLEGGLIEELLEQCRTVQVPEGAELLREGAYVRDLPLVLDGLVRVYLGHEDKELLLYYIQPAESCVMSLSALLERAPSRIYAVTEKPSTLLLLPETDLRRWLREYPSLNELLYHQFHERYRDLVETIQLVTFGDLATRLLDHLRKAAQVNGSDLVNVRHSRLAQELGTAREVVTRTLKKLERDGLVKQEAGGLRVLDP
ncbi:MAG: Crp/Fnr family transcriptional regulator [Flavobacteriales bacterium]